MFLGFKPDVFSKSRIIWQKKIIDKNLFNQLNEFIYKNVSSTNFLIEKRKGLEINSNNFKIRFKSKKIILKKWPQKMSVSQINSILNLMSWLNSKKLPVQKPLLFKNKKNLIKYKSSFWSIFNFIEGYHFKGNINEFNNVVHNFGKLSYVLSKYSKNKITDSPKYFSTENHKTLHIMKKNYSKFNKIFGKKYSTQIKAYMPKIIRLFNQINNLNFNLGEKQVAHMDIHPHNIIIKGNKVKAILDFDSCYVIPIRYSIAFAGLKLCKQTIVFNNKSELKTNIGKKFIKIFNKEFPSDGYVYKNFYYCAVAEVLRRLFYIFELNLKFKEKKWNKVIPIQLGHLDECKELFLL